MGNKNFKYMKKKGIVLCFVLLFILTSSSFFSIAEEENNDKILEFEFNFKSPHFTMESLNGKEFTKITMQDVANYGVKAGHPFLQTRPVNILLPYNTEIDNIIVQAESVKINLEEKGLDLIEKPMVPYQKSIPISENSSDGFAFDQDVYNSTDPIQENPFEKIGVNSCRGYSILTAYINPIQYIPGNGEIYYYSQIKIVIELNENTNVNRMFRNDFADQKWIQSLVINPETTTTYDTQNFGSSFYTGGLCDPSDNNGNGYDYVIITRSNLVDFSAAYNWTDFINRKQADGLDTTIVTYEDIIGCSDYFNTSSLFNDSAAKIREFLRDAYQDWGLQYVLIAGDDEGVNGIPRREMDSYAEYSVDSDLYWSNLDNNFNADQDSSWGEEGDTGFDLFSELYIGSITCDEGSDISNWMKKSFYYEDSWEQDYLDNAAFYGGDLDTFWTWYSEGDDFMDFTLYGTDNWLGPYPDHDGPWPSFLGFLEGFDTWNASHPGMMFDTSVRWTGEGDDSGDNGPNPGWQGGSTSISVNGFKNAINNDECTIINGLAHSDSDMALDVDDSEWESDYHNTKPFFLHDYGCHSGDMDASDDGVLHSMLFHSDTELAFATVMNTGYGWGNLYCTNSSSAIQQKLFWNYMFDLNKCGGIENWQLGKAQAYSKDEMAYMILWDYDDGSFRETIQCCLLFGDPALCIKPPSTPDRKVTNVLIDWNLISLPFNNTVEKEDVVIDFAGEEYTWSDAVTNGYISNFIFDWNRSEQSYSFSTQFKASYGYWLYSYELCELWVENVTLSSSTPYITEVQFGWNLFSVPYDENVSKQGILVNDASWDTAVSNGWISGYIFGWDRSGQQYDFVETFEPGYSYWMYASQPCILERSV